MGTNGAASNASLTNNQATLLGTVTVGGNLTIVRSVGNLTETGVATVTGTSSFTTSAASATIALGSTNLLTGAVTLSTNGTGANASLTNGVATVLAASSIGGNLAITDTVGNITQTGVLTVPGTATFTASAAAATITF